MVFTAFSTITPPQQPGQKPRFADIWVNEKPRDGTALGSVRASSDGDFDGASKATALRARLVRLVTNPPTAYTHLREWGLRVRRGERMTPSVVSTLQILAVRLLREDPDVFEAKVIVQPNPNALKRALLLAIWVRTTQGEDRFTTVAGEAG